MGHLNASALFPHADPKLIADVAKDEGRRFQAMGDAARERYLRYYGRVWLDLLPAKRQRQLGLEVAP